MKMLLIGLSVLCVIATLMPILAFKQWWIRVFDFPILQVATATLLALLCWIFIVELPPALSLEGSLLLLLVLAFAYQCKVILPYTPLHKKYIGDAQSKKPDDRLKVLVANVYQDNQDYETFIRVFMNADPDIAVLLEVNETWNSNLTTLKKTHPYTLEHPLENYYGIVLISRLPLKDVEVKFLINDEIPSIHGSAQLPNGTWVKLYCLHPMPPSPTENEKSLDRDAELLMVAKAVTEKDYPAIVLGDLNDVAWSHTTRLFQRTSQLLDPRIGRGFYNTFHSQYPLFRWPLDHMFVSRDFTLSVMKRLPPFGSDHFAVFAELYYTPHTTRNEKPEKASTSDKQEAMNTVREGLEEN